MMNPSVEQTKNNFISCCYINACSGFKIVRIRSLDNPNLEKVVLPGSKFYFKAQPEDFLEIYSNNTIQSMLEERISCSHLQIELN